MRGVLTILITLLGVCVGGQETIYDTYTKIGVYGNVFVSNGSVYNHTFTDTCCGSFAFRTDTANQTNEFSTGWDEVHSLSSIIGQLITINDTIEVDNVKLFIRAENNPDTLLFDLRPADFDNIFPFSDSIIFSTYLPIEDISSTTLNWTTVNIVNTTLYPGEYQISISCMGTDPDKEVFWGRNENGAGIDYTGGWWVAVADEGNYIDFDYGDLFF